MKSSEYRNEYLVVCPIADKCRLFARMEGRALICRHKEAHVHLVMDCETLCKEHGVQCVPYKHSEGEPCTER